jgi:hypothetical protein
MSETNGESKQVTDLTGQQSLLTAEVIDFLGRDEVMAVERPFLHAQKFSELARRPNPFEVSHGLQKGVELSEGMSNVVNMLEDRRYHYLDEDLEEQVQEMREIGKPLGEWVHSVREIIRLSLKKTDINLTKIEAGLDDLEDHPDAMERYLHQYYDALREAADELVVPEAARNLKLVASVELHATFIHAISAVLMKKPELKEELQMLTTLHHNAPGNEYADRLGTFESALREEGEKNRKVRKYSRESVVIWTYKATADGFLKSINEVKDLRGKEIHTRIIDLAKQATVEPSSEMLQTLAALHDKFTLQCEALTEEDRDTALAAEQYIVTRANEAHELIRQAGIKLDQNERRTLHEIKDPDLQRRFRKVAGLAINAPAESYENVQFESTFRLQCRDARDILAGGGRIEHPDAKDLAAALHKLNFGNGRKIPLEIYESGFLVGIAAGKIDSLLAVITRMEDEDEDPQLGKLRVEMPERYRAIKDFDLDAVLASLKELFDDAYDNQALSSVLGAHSVTARETINRLWQERQEQPETEDNEIQEEEIEEYESEPEQEQEQEMSNEELAIINAEIVDIAEQLEWVVFPPGANINVIRHILGENRVDLSKVNWERINHLLYLADEYEGTVYRSAEPKLGTSVPYLVATMHIHGRKFAVAECPEKGNATYVIDESNAAGTWEEIMRLPRRDARGLGAKAVIHSTEDNHLPRIIKRINSLLTVRTS